ncbi:MAG: isocitrate lyase, partial [Candidatus Puniceispirillaceae bacterium]
MTDAFETHTQSYAGRFAHVTRDYDMAEVARLSGSVRIEYSLARRGADKLWALLHSEDYLHTLGAMTGNQAMQQIRAGLKAIYLSGWQVAADSNTAGSMYPDQSIYPANSGPELAKRINKTLIRADQIETLEDGAPSIDWLAPIVADCEAGFGGALNAFELTRAYIEAGAAGVHFEDQLASEKKCGHMGDKVLIPVQQAITNLNAARLAADVSGVSTIIMARTDAESAKLITSDIDPRDKPFIHGERSDEGFYRLRDEDAFDRCVARGLAFAPYADLLWMETSTPDLDQAEAFAKAIRSQYPEQMLAYNCSPSFNWSANLNEQDIARFQNEIGKMGYKFQFITLAGFHSLNYGMYELAHAYKDKGMAAYSA